MDLWDIFNTSHTAPGTTIIDSCPQCNVAFEYIEGGKLCPSCNQVEDFNFIDQAAPVQSVVIVRGGQIQARTQVYDRSKILVDTYNRFFVNSKLRPSSDLVKDAVEIITVAQKFSSNSRGRNLNAMLAGAIAIAAGLNTHVIAEPALSRIFRTRAGISSGRNKIYTSLAKGKMLGLDTEGFTKDIKFVESDKAIANMIKRSMRDVGLDPAARKIYMFIKSLVMIEKLYQYVDQQIMNTKISASIYFYFVYAAGLATRPLIKDVAAKLEISSESIKKYYIKLHFAIPSIRLIVRVLDIPFNIDMVSLNNRIIAK